MAAVLAAASYSWGGFSPCLAVSERRVRVPGGSIFHLEPRTIGMPSSLVMWKRSNRSVISPERSGGVPKYVFQPPNHLRGKMAGHGGSGGHTYIIRS